MHYIHVIQRQVQTNLNNSLRAAGIGNQTWRVLATLVAKDAQPIGHIAEMTVIDRSNLGRLLDTLETDGLVTKAALPNERRTVIVRLTRKGLEIYKSALPIVLNSYRRLFADVSDEERQVFMRVLRRMKANSISIWDEALEDEGAASAQEAVV
jgi:DNA-binding MarR family transcriptional regulator